MYYTGMASANFTSSTFTNANPSHALNISSLVTTSIIVVTFMVLGLTLVTSLIDRRFSAQAFELESSEKRFRQILETTFDAFVGMDSQGRILDWNAQAERAFGWSQAELDVCMRVTWNRPYGTIQYGTVPYGIVSHGTITRQAGIQICDPGTFCYAT